MPEIFWIKALLEYMIKNEDLKPDLVVDYHAHSRKQNGFFFGCRDKKIPEDHDQPDETEKLDKHKHDNSLPTILSKLSPIFNPQDCVFKYLRKNGPKSGTLRYVGNQIYGIPLVYTLETTYNGCDKPFSILNGFQLSIQQLETLG